MKSDNAGCIGILLVDGSGQTHQRKDIPVTPDGKWHDLTIKPEEIAGVEHWGGPNDGPWRGPVTELAISLSARSDPKAKQPAVCLADIRAEVWRSVFVQPAAFPWAQ